MKSQPPAGAKRIRAWQQLLEFGKWVVEGEELPRDDVEPSTQLNGASPLSWLVSTDVLPNRTVPAPGSLGFLPWLVSGDHLPGGWIAPRPEPGFLRWVASREDLPATSSDQLPAPRSFLRWLLSSEHLGCSESLHSTKEVPSNEP